MANKPQLTSRCIDGMINIGPHRYAALIELLSSILHMKKTIYLFQRYKVQSGGLTRCNVQKGSFLVLFLQVVPAL